MMRHKEMLTLSLMCMLGNAPMVAAENLGRFFSTPAERAAIDEARSVYEYGKVIVPQKAAAAPVVEQVTINGVVVRSSGHNASWINGTSIASGDMTPEGVRVETLDRSGGTVRIIMPNGLDTVSLKPGQQINVVKGSVQEAWEIEEAESQNSAFEEKDGAEIEEPEETSAKKDEAPLTDPPLPFSDVRKPTN